SAAFAFLGLGGFLYYNTNILNTYRPRKAERQLHAGYEKRYKKFFGLPQPRITAVRVQVDLYPKQQNAVVTATYVLRNRTAGPITSVQLAISEDMVIRRL